MSPRMAYVHKRIAHGEGAACGRFPTFAYDTQVETWDDGVNCPACWATRSAKPIAPPPIYPICPCCQQSMDTEAHATFKRSMFALRAVAMTLDLRSATLMLEALGEPLEEPEK